jgi:predicted transcriptional regulator
MISTTVKQRILSALEEMPPDVTFSEVMERLYFLYKLDQGLKQVADGDIMSHEEAKERIKKWQG